MSISQKFFRVGYELYIARQPLTACHNAVIAPAASIHAQRAAEMMRRGWLAALDADAECATVGYASKMGF
jgi:hypothetical protein